MPSHQYTLQEVLDAIAAHYAELHLSASFHPPTRNDAWPSVLQDSLKRVRTEGLVDPSYCNPELTQSLARHIALCICWMLQNEAKHLNTVAGRIRAQCERYTKEEKGPTNL